MSRYNEIKKDCRMDKMNSYRSLASQIRDVMTRQADKGSYTSMNTNIKDILLNNKPAQLNSKEKK